MKLLDTVVKTKTGNPVAKKNASIVRTRLLRSLLCIFLGAMNKENKKESDYRSLSLSSTLQSTQ